MEGEDPETGSLQTAQARSVAEAASRWRRCAGRGRRVRCGGRLRPSPTTSTPMVSDDGVLPLRRDSASSELGTFACDVLRPPHRPGRSGCFSCRFPAAFP